MTERVFPAVAAPASEPLTLGEARAHLRLDDTTEDALVLGYLMAAREEAEAFTGQSFISRTATALLKAWPDEIELCAFPASVTSITYTDTAGTTQTLATTEYVAWADGKSFPRIYPASGKSWPTLGTDPTITITATVGYSSMNAVPQSVRQAMMTHLTWQHENRAGGEMPAGHSFYALLNKLRLF